MKDVFVLLPLLLKLITPDPAMKGIRLKRKELRGAKKNLRIAEKMYNEIYKTFKKDGFTEEETSKLEELKQRVLDRKMELI